MVPSLSTDLAKVFQIVQKLRTMWQEGMDRLRHERLVGQAGAGMVSVEVNGLGEVLKVQLDPILWQKADRELAETLIPAATNEARAKARQRFVDVCAEVAQQAGVPIGREFWETVYPL